MKKILFFLLVIFWALSAMAKISYVKQGGTGTGTSWANASGNLQTVITGSAVGDQIWVAAGIYQPASGQSFSMKEGVAIYGGFVGNETSLTARNWATHVTNLKGNGNTVINNISNNLTSAAIINGFSITNGTNVVVEGGLEQGGGMYNKSASPTIVNCTFSGNSANYGAGIFNQNSAPHITNCSFIGNDASFGGGGIYNAASSPIIINCTFSGNISPASPGSSIYNISGSSPTITNCIIYGNSEPAFYNEASTSNPVFTYCLLQGLTADATAHNLGGSTDPMFTNPSSSSAPFTGGDYSLKSTSPVINIGNNSAYPANLSTDLDLNANPRLSGTTIDFGAYEYQQPVAPVLHIRFVTTTGTGDGSSWANASSNLQTIINNSLAADQVWVAKGSYQPASGQSFIMKEGVAIYGGFVGNETSLATRNRVTNVTTLQGNGSRVITNSSNNLTTAAILDGFTVTGGNINDVGGGIYNNGSSPTISNCTISNNTTGFNSGVGGGGICNINSSPTISNCTISNNTPGFGGGGGGIYNGSSSPVITNCIFSGNTAGDYGSGSGGGISNNASSAPTITYCTFSGNKAGASLEGGGIANDHSSPNIANCTFWGNTAVYGGGMSNVSSSPTVTNCIFSGNSTDNAGGGMWNVTSSSPTVTNCLFSGNKVVFFGGGMDNEASSPHIVNCTFSGNYAANSGGGLSNYDGSSPIITNCIIYGNTDAITGDASNTITVTYSIVQGGFPGTGNSSGDPVFTNAPSALTAPFTNGDYSLQGTSAAINVGNNSAYPNNLNTSLDLAGNPRLYGTTIDMGAYEYQHAPAVVSHIKYVTVSGTGDGSSWANASSNLQTIINNSPAGNQVWVAAGTYQATSGSSFSMKEGVAIYGGFVGNETALTARNWATNITILRGNGSVVVSNSSLTNAAVLDGFTITGGSGNSGGGIYNFSASPNILNCIFSGNSATFGGGMGNLGSSPTIMNCLFSGNAGTFGGGLYNSGSSPNIVNCTFSGNKADNNGGGISNYPNSSPIISNSIIYGNYGNGNGDGIANTDATSVPVITYSIVQGGYAGTGNSGNDPVFSNAPSYSTAPFTGGDYSLQGTSPALNTGNNGAYLGNLATDFDLAHNPRLYGTIIDMGAYEYQHAPTPPANLPIRYVKQNGTGDGSSWANASADLQAMINASVSGNQVWVAAGTYQPITSGNSFSMKEGVAIYGGFAGNETSVAARNFATNVTTLQGNGNKVVNNNNLTLAAVLDGFTISGGNITNDNGGGMANNFASPTINNCRFLNNVVNTSGGGGGIFNYSSNPNITKCVFSGNTVAGAGGGISNQSSSPNITNCIFSGNTANGLGGGGIYNVSSASPTIINSLFSGNTANVSGAGLLNYSSSPNIINCTFSGNLSVNNGGGICDLSSSSPNIANSILYGNSGQNGSGFYDDGSGVPVISYSLVQGLPADAANHNLDGSTDPLFISAPDATNAPFTSGNYQLQANSVAIDAGKNSSYVGNLNTDKDLGGGPRLLGVTIDMGAYEDLGVPVSPGVLPLNGSINGNLTSTTPDVYTLTTNADGLLRLSLKAVSPADLYVTLYDNDGTTALGVTQESYNNSTATVIVDGLAPGTYKVQISPYSTRFGAYTLSDSLFTTPLANDSEPNGNMATAVSLTQNGSTTGHVGYYYNNQRDSTDWYKVTTTADGLLRVYLSTQLGSKYSTTSTNPLDVNVWLYDGDGTTQLGFAEVYSGSGPATNLITADGLAPGTYYIKVQCYNPNNEFANYTLSDSLFTTPLANDVEPNGTVATAVALTQNGSATGHVGYHYTNQRDSTDWYKVTTTADGLLRVYLSTQLGSIYSTTGTNPLDVNVWLYDGDGTTQLGFAETYSGSGPATNLITADGLAPGTYYIKVQCYNPNNEFANYTLSDSLFTAPLANDSEPNGGVAKAVVLAQNGSATGHVGYHYNNQRDSTDWYKVTTTADGLLRVYLSTQLGSIYSTTGTNPLDVNVWLYDGDGTTQLGFAETYSGSGPATNLITADGLAPGTYYIKVQCYNPNTEFANYTISDSLFTTPLANDAEPNGNMATALVLAQNGSATGHVGYHYNNQRDSTDWYKVTTTADGLLRVYLSTQLGSIYSTTGTNPLDVNVWLYDGDGTTQLGFAETYSGSGPATNLITADGLAPGTYYIKVQCYNPNNEFANYTLSDSLFEAKFANDPEPNGNIATAVMFPSNSSLTGHIGYHYNGQTDVDDYYKVTIPGGPLNVYLSSDRGSLYSSNSLDMVITVYNSDGTTISGTKEIYNGNGPTVDSLVFSSLPAGDYYIKVTDYSASSEFGVYSLSVSSAQVVFPVTYIHFDGQMISGKGVLNWATATESNNKGFNIERSADAISFTTIGFVAGNGNTNTIKIYGYTDVQPLIGANFYRLKQIDNDGKFAYSNVVQLANSKKSVLTIFPNPASNTLFVTTAGLVGNIKVLDMLGRTMTTVAITGDKTAIDVSKLAGGTYYCVVGGSSVLFVKAK